MTTDRSVSKYLLWGIALVAFKLVFISWQRDGFKTWAGSRLFVVSLNNETTMHTCSKRRDTNMLWQTVRNPEEFNTGGSGHSCLTLSLSLPCVCLGSSKKGCSVSQTAPGCSQGLERTAGRGERLWSGGERVRRRWPPDALLGTWKCSHVDWQLLHEIWTKV